jgi:hypothetical protein
MAAGLLIFQDASPAMGAVQFAALGFMPLLDPVGIENMAGWQNSLAFIPAHSVTTVPSLPAEPASNEDLVTAAGDFVYKTEGTKPMYIYATDKTVKYTAENQGETDGQSFKITGEFFYPGTKTAVAAFARKVNNTPGYLVLISPENEQYLVGQKGLPCSIKPSFDGGQARSDRRGFKFTFEADSYAPYIRLEATIPFDDLIAEDPIA